MTEERALTKAKNEATQGTELVPRTQHKTENVPFQGSDSIKCKGEVKHYAYRGPVTVKRMLTWFFALTCMILYQSTGIGICFLIMEKGNSDFVPKPTFLSGLMNSIIWGHYSIHSRNRFGFVTWALAIYANICFTIFYYIYSEERDMLKGYLVLIFVIIISSITYINRCLPLHEIRDAAGSFSTFVTLMSQIFPLMQMQAVIDTGKSKAQDLSYLFPRLILGFFTHLIYCWYGYVITDHYVELVNSIAAIVAGTNLCVFIYVLH